jgi:uncharacterized protein
MNCPVCNVQLVMTERQGIEIDYCPKCRGVWLDRGELDKIIERSVSAAPQTQYRESDHETHGRHRGKHNEHEKGHYGKKRNFLLDLFD